MLHIYGNIFLIIWLSNTSVCKGFVYFILWTKIEFVVALPTEDIP
jgi:hypothetical protein